MTHSFAIESLETVRAVSAVPLSARGLPPNTYEVIRQAAERAPEADALVYLDDPARVEEAERISYAQLFGRVTQAARLFAGHGIDRKDVVSILLPNVPAFHYAFWGAEAAGIANPLNPMLSGDALADLMEAAGTKVLVTLSASQDSAIEAKLGRIRARLPDLVVFTAGGGKPGEGDFLAACRMQSDEPLADLPRAEDIAAQFQTGGTTGRPKLAMHTHANEVFMAWTFAGLLDCAPGQTVLGGLPLFHVNGVFVTGLGPLLGGARVLIATAEGYRNRALMAHFWQVIERFEVNMFSCVPTILAGLMNLPLNGADVSSLRYVLCGAAPLSESLLRNFEAQFDLKVLEGYGLTEGTCASTVNPTLGERRAGSVGLPLPYQAVEIRRSDEEGRFHPVGGPGQTGAVFVSGPNVFAGYVQASANRGVLEDGWLNTGDLGYLDADGYLWLAGRSKDLIIRGGHNIDPKSIEEVLARHPAVSEVAAVGKPDPRVGELPAAFVTLKAGQPATPQALLDFAAEHLSERAARPVEVIVVEGMPLTAVGKIFKPELRRRLTEQVLRETIARAGVAASSSVELHDQYGLIVRLRADHTDAIEAARRAIEAFPVRIEG